MVKKTVFLLLASAGISLIHACRYPDNTFIIEFYLDTMISVDLTVFERIGQDGVNYYKKSSDYMPDCYYYTSHHNNQVLVSIGPFHIQFVVDTNMTAIGTIKGDICVNTELQWLDNAKIVSITKSKREFIARAFSGNFESMVYWTAWDTILSSDNMLDAGQSSSSVPVFVSVDCALDAPELNFPPEILSYSISGIPEKRNQLAGGPVISNGKLTSSIFLLNGRKILLKPHLRKNPNLSSKCIVKNSIQKGVRGHFIELR